MSISPYQYQLLSQSFATIKPNFHCFCVSFNHRLKMHPMSMRVPEAEHQILAIEYQLRAFIQQSLLRIANQKELCQYIVDNIASVKTLRPSVCDIKILCNCFLDTLKVHLGKQFTLAVRNAWKRALHIVANVLKSELFGMTNVVYLDQFRQKHQVHHS
ncbi:globin [Pseudoalteromonas sp. SMS1]|uniref:globin n=1 Tax=Pseudoalteromonas sp. SMS1 TaxID=2908894 RepID=UPI001F2AF660|nr:globin [Pseudoalteromonas sp. SMS1]MCF2857841.1 globin [Pseudoalteromonas sp. SMS1]